MENNIFDETRRLVSPLSAALCYGFQPNRSNFIQCPFHAERTASLKLYDNSWHCFGCGLGGSSIDFTAKLFDLSPLDAVRKMNVDFNLALPLDKPPSKEQQKAVQRRREILEIKQNYQKWQDGLLTLLNAAYRTGHIALQKFDGLNQLTEAEVLAIQWLESLENWSDCLMSDDMEQQIQIFRDRKEIKQLCETILNHMPMKSNVA